MAAFELEVFISSQHLQAKGMVEKGVSSAKNLFKKCQKSGDDPYLTLLSNIGNTSKKSGSTAQRTVIKKNE